MISHRIQRAALSAVLAVALGCGANGGGTSAASVATTTSAPTLVPYVSLAADSSSLAASDPALTTTSGDTCSSPPLTTALTAPVGAGEFAAELVDAPNPAVEHIWITIESVSAHVAGQGWTYLMPPGSPLVFLDLLQLKATGTPPAALGFVKLPAGATVTQIRLLLSQTTTPDNTTGFPQYVELKNASQKSGLQTVELKVPSGYETGIKILGPWTVSGCTRTTVTLDFDGEKSLWYHPNGPETEWILRPVIHAKGSRVSGIECPPGETTPPGDTTPPSTPPAATEPPVVPADPPADTQPPTDTQPGSTETPVTPPPPVDTTPVPVCTAPASDPVPLPTGTSLPGTPCTAGLECTSGTCTGSVCGPGGPGASCTMNIECLSGTCKSDGTCDVSGTLGPCRVGTDCASGVCAANGSCTPTTSGLPTGAACSAGMECASGSCQNTTCAPAEQGAACSATNVCGAGLQCAPATSICVPIIMAQ